MIKKFDEHELVEKVISELKEISYILEDVNGFIVQYDITHSRYINANSLFRIVVSNKYLLDKLYNKPKLSWT